MTHYRTDRNHSEFLLFDVLGVADAYGRAPFEDVDVDAARDVLEQAERFATERLAPSFVVGDRCPPVLDRVTHEVAIPGEVATALREHLASDWLGLDLPPGRCEVRVPASLRWAATEFAMGANPAVGMCTQLVPQVVRLLDTAGTEPSDEARTDPKGGMRWRDFCLSTSVCRRRCRGTAGPCGPACGRARSLGHRWSAV